jgi:TRAP-type C4-dicarboxylate transport system permease small subunit
LRELLNKVTILGRYFLSILSLLAVVGWLGLSYLPRTTFPLPVLALPLGWSAGLQIAAGIGFVLFVLIQLVIVRLTFNLRNQKLYSQDLPNQDLQNAAKGESIALNVAAELFWTMLPLVMTLGLALASYQSWAHI